MKVCDDIVEKSVQSLTLQINNGHFLIFFIFPQKYMSYFSSSPGKEGRYIK